MQKHKFKLPFKVGDVVRIKKENEGTLKEDPGVGVIISVNGALERWYMVRWNNARTRGHSAIALEMVSEA